MAVRIEWTGNVEQTVKEATRQQAMVAAAAMAALIESATPAGGPFRTAAGSTSAAPTSTGARVNIGSPYWHLIEFGTAGSPPRAGIRKALAAFGGRVEGRI